MIVRFTSSKAGEMIMFAEHARRIFDLLGKAGSARGVFTAEELPGAMAQLRAAIDAAKAEEKRAPAKDETEDATADDEQKKADAVSLAQRATPLLRLMERTQKEGGFILWEAAQDF
jgi:hypothetical protein